MIVSASRRTDIPACYPRWFSRRVNEGYVLVRNTYRYHEIVRVPLGRDNVDAFVFWTKNPLPFLPYLSALEEYPYYFHFTLTSYGKDIERNVPSKNDVLIPAFERLSRMIGPKRVIWRYDPIFFSGKYTLDYHKKYFSMLAERLSGFTETCVVSFLDMYPSIGKAMNEAGYAGSSSSSEEELLRHIVDTGRKTGISIRLCCEKDYENIPGLARSCCIDKVLIENLSGHFLDVDRDRNQRSGCNCAGSIDIGNYGTCSNGCIYCYANSKRRPLYTTDFDPLSPLLCSRLEDDDVIVERDFKSCRAEDNSLFQSFKEP